MIPEAAVEALARILANEALFNADIEGYGWDSDHDSSDHFMPRARSRAREYLEAAAPHMLAQAWESGANAAWERSTPIVNGQNYQWRYSGDPINPYRSGE